MPGAGRGSFTHFDYSRIKEIVTQVTWDPQINQNKRGPVIALVEVQCWVQFSDFAFYRQSQGHQQEASAPEAGHADVEHGMQMPFACLGCSSTQEIFMNQCF